MTLLEEIMDEELLRQQQQQGDPNWKLNSKFAATGPVVIAGAPGPGNPWEPDPSAPKIGVAPPATVYNEPTAMDIARGAIAPPVASANMPTTPTLPSGNIFTDMGGKVATALSQYADVPPDVSPVIAGAAAGGIGREFGTSSILNKPAQALTSDQQAANAMRLPFNPYSMMMPVDPYAEPIHTLGVNGFRTGASRATVDYSPVEQQQAALRHNRGLLDTILRSEGLAADQAYRERVGMANAESRNLVAGARAEAMRDAERSRASRAIADPTIPKEMKRGIIESVDLDPALKANLLIENQFTNVGPGGKPVIAAVGPDGSFEDIMKRGAGEIETPTLRRYLETKGVTPELANKRISAIRSGNGWVDEKNRPEAEFILRLYPELAMTPQAPAPANSRMYSQNPFAQ